jgi:hypothetical protein
MLIYGHRSNTLASCRSGLRSRVRQRPPRYAAPRCGCCTPLLYRSHRPRRLVRQIMSPLPICHGHPWVTTLRVLGSKGPLPFPMARIAVFRSCSYLASSRNISMDGVGRSSGTASSAPSIIPAARSGSSFAIFFRLFTPQPRDHGPRRALGRWLRRCGPHVIAWRKELSLWPRDSSG